MRSNLVSVYLSCLLVLLVAGLPSFAQAELDCTDFLTFSYPGYAKLPADAFDYNSSVHVLRASSGRLDSFSFPEVDQGYFFVALSPYTNANLSRRERNVSTGEVVYQYTRGSSEYYYRVLNGSTVPWFCNLEKMADLTVSVKKLAGSFYSSTGERLNVTTVLAVAFDAGMDDGFLVAGFGTAREVLVGAVDGVAGLPVGYILHDAGNGTFFASSYKQVRFHVPASKAPFCTDFSSFCLDAVGVHAPACKGAGIERYSCSGNVCVANLTACKFGCESAECLAEAATPTALASEVPSASASVIPVAPSVKSTVAPNVAPSSGSNGMMTAIAVIVLLALLAAGYYVAVKKRRPKGL